MASRSERFSKTVEALREARDAAFAEMEELRDELQSWLDNIPENLSSGSKAEELETAISELDDLLSEIEGVDFDRDVSFPGMF